MFDQLRAALTNRFLPKLVRDTGEQTDSSAGFRVRLPLITFLPSTFPF